MLSEVCIRYRKTEVLRDHVRFVFNRMEGKQEIVVLKENESIRNGFQNPLLKFIQLQLGN
jgi:hypothetical protein